MYLELLALLCGFPVVNSDSQLVYAAGFVLSDYFLSHLYKEIFPFLGK